jgi:hypothetical protein
MSVPDSSSIVAWVCRKLYRVRCCPLLIALLSPAAASSLLKVPSNPYGCKPSSKLLAAIAGNNGSFRSVIFSVLRLVKRNARQSMCVSDTATATIQQAIAKKTHLLGTNI